MVSATDYLVGDMIRFLSDQGMLSNTVFFVYPDHLLMGNKSVITRLKNPIAVERDVNNVGTKFSSEEVSSPSIYLSSMALSSLRT